VRFIVVSNDKRDPDFNSIEPLVPSRYQSNSKIALSVYLLFQDLITATSHQLAAQPPHEEKTSTSSPDLNP
jgi:hypothetical protein